VMNGGVADTAIGPIPVTGATSGAVDVLVRPEQLAVEPDGDLRVALVEYYGHDSLVIVESAGQLLRSRAVSLDVQRGDKVGLRFVGPPTVAYESD
jgi:ABC-type sugar transport system ATPase subunit